jgi:hypothetical protein
MASRLPGRHTVLGVRRRSGNFPSAPLSGGLGHLAHRMLVARVTRIFPSPHSCCFQFPVSPLVACRSYCRSSLPYLRVSARPYSSASSPRPPLRRPRLCLRSTVIRHARTPMTDGRIAAWRQTEVFLHLLFNNVRVHFWADPSHCANNDAQVTTTHSALTEHRKKILYLGRFSHGPFPGPAGGRFGAVQAATWDALARGLDQPGTAEHAVWSDHLPAICQDLGLADPDLAASQATAKSFVKTLAGNRGRCAGSSRWFSAEDTGAALLRARHAKLLLCELSPRA